MSSPITRRGIMLVLSSPSGAGKTSICNRLLQQGKELKLSVSATTRQRRPGEVEGKDYYFVSKKKFANLKEKNFFIETAKNFNNLYGSPYKNINKSIKNNQHILFDIDWKGARKIRRNYNKENILDFFILPPSKSELKRRLKKRGRDNNKEINLRLSYAIDEMKHYNEYKYVLINDNVKNTVEDIIKIIEYNNLISKNKKLLQSKLYKIINP